MAEFTTSPNMSLPIPNVGEAPGPNYAIDVNSSLTLIDQHNHSSGSGVPVNPAGLDINSDLSMQNNNLILSRSMRFVAQDVVFSDPADVRATYVVDDDLYFSDGAGNQVRITQSGGVAGTPGSIANLVSPASASYVSGNQTFVWQSDATTAANMDAGSLLLRNITPASNALTLSPPTLSTNYTLILPALPNAQKFMTLDAAGNMAAPWAVDNTSLEIAAGTTLQVKNGGITRPKLGPLGQQVSTSCGTFSTDAMSFTDVTNLTVTITTTGRPVMLMMVGNAANFGGRFQLANTSGLSGTALSQANMRFFRDNTTSVGATNMSGTVTISGGTGMFSSLTIPCSSVSAIDFVSAGTYTYKFQVLLATANSSLLVQDMQLVAYEL